MYIAATFKMADEDDWDDIDSQKGSQKGTQKDDEDYVPAKRNKRSRTQSRPRVRDTWTYDDIEKLITEVEVRPCIWDVGTTDYRNRTKRDSAWRDISTAFDNDKSVDQMMAKWQSLRTQYRTSLSNAKRTRSV